MAGKIVVVGDEDAVFGLGLIGFRGHPVRNLDQARAALKRALADPETALVLLTENWAEAKDEHPAEGAALVVEIPCAGPAAPSTAGLQRTIERTLGVRLEGM